MPSTRTLAALAVPGERQLAPVTSSFILFGVFWGAWAVSTAELERATKLSNAGFGLLLSIALLGAATGNALGGSASERWGTARVLGAALAVWGGLDIVAGLVRPRLLLAAVLVVAIAVGGLVDVAMNVAASSSLSATPGYLVRFHARFNAGAAVGAAIMGWLLAAGYTWRFVWLAVGAAAGALAVACLRSSMPAAAPGDAVRLRDALAVLRTERLVLLAFMFAIGAMVEGGIELWGVLYLRTKLHSGLLVGAGGAVVAYAAAAAARTLLGVRAGRRGAEVGILIGAGTAAAGIAVLAAGATAAVAAAGLVVAAGGISMCWPLFIARAGAGRSRAGAAVGAVSAAGYLGLMAGPALVGLISKGIGLRGGLIVLAAAAVAVAVAPAVNRRGNEERQGPGGDPPARGAGRAS